MAKESAPPTPGSHSNGSMKTMIPKMARAARLIPLLLAALLTSGAAEAKSAASPVAPKGRAPSAKAGRSPALGADPDVMNPRGRSRTIAFSTDEATNVSVAVSPDGQWLLFDMLGEIWRLPAKGGEAKSLTADSGVALNFHPRYAPDGARIAFISDRSGQNAVWVMRADGTQPRPLFLDSGSRFSDPVWAPDGKSLVAVRTFKTPGRNWHRQNETLWRLFLDGSAPAPLKGGRTEHYTMPAFSPDGGFLYFNLSFSTGRGNGLLNAGGRILKYDLSSGRTFDLDGAPFTGIPPELQKALDNTSYAEVTAGVAPPPLSATPSPDGRYIAFAREVPGETFTYRGHDLGPRTTLYLRDLKSGAERRLIAEAAKDSTRMNAQYSYRPFPAFSWSPDSRFLYANYRGKLHRISVEDGAEAEIPFRAKVERVASEQTRGRVSIDDDRVQALLLQWPSASQDGRTIAFAAFGRVWVADGPGGEPRPVAGTGAGVQQMTPAVSPDGASIAFTTWSAEAGGQVLIAPTRGGPARMVASGAAFLYPAWSKDGTRLVLTTRPSVAAPGAGFSTADTFSMLAQRAPASFELASSPARRGEAGALGDGWAVAALDLASGVLEPLAQTGSLRPARYLDDGSVQIEDQTDPAALLGLLDPFPTERTLAAVSLVKVLSPDGRSRTLARFAPREIMGKHAWNYPSVSPDGKRLLWSADGKIFVARLDDPIFSPQTDFDADPNIARPGVTEIAGARGGDFPRWRTASVIDYVSGPRFASFDLRSGKRTETDVALSAPRHRGEGAKLLRGATLITMRGDEVIARGDIRVDGARIVCVGSCPRKAGDRVVDVTGKYIVPGFIDVHAHHLSSGPTLPGVLWQKADFNQDLAYGVTTIVDPSVSSLSAFSWAQAIEAGVVRGPRAFSSGDIVIGQAGMFGDNLELTSPALARFQVDRRVGQGALEIKNYRLASRRQQQWLMQAARERKITVTAEGGPLLADVGMALDGQTGWEHMIGDLPLYKDASTFFGLAQMNYSPTVIVAGHVNGAKEYWRARQDLAHDDKYRRFADADRLRRNDTAFARLPKSEFSFPLVAEGLADIIRAGGSGTIGEHGEEPGVGSHWELWSYAEALKPIETLRLATAYPAHFLGLDAELGSLEAGKIADLLVLDRDPLADIHNTTSIRYVMKAGELLDGLTLQPALEAAPTAR